MKDQGGRVALGPGAQGPHQADSHRAGPARPPSDLEALSTVVDGLAGHIVGAAVWCPTCTTWALVEAPASRCPHTRHACAELRHLLEAVDVRLGGMPA